MIPRAVLVTSQLFVLVSLIHELSCFVVGGLVVSNVVVVDGSVSFDVVVSGDVQTVLVD